MIEKLRYTKDKHIHDHGWWYVCVNWEPLSNGGAPILPKEATPLHPPIPTKPQGLLCWSCYASMIQSTHAKCSKRNMRVIPCPRQHCVLAYREKGS